MKTSLVITTISAPTRAMQEFAAKSRSHGIDFVVVGDSASPTDFHLDNCDYYSIRRQLRSDFQYASAAPLRHYARKNIGYLVAIAGGADILVESDDDNFPLQNFWAERFRIRRAHLLKNAGWTNAYSHFSSAAVWPRGFPLDSIRQPLPLPADMPVGAADCPIQQGLCNGDPDVDAIYRLVNGMPVEFEDRTSLALSDRSWCPFNSQNTSWWRDAFPLLYLPGTCSMRMTDIWRSLVAQRIAWTNGWSILFHSPSVFQERNVHDLMSDFNQEIQGYLHNRKIAERLDILSLRPGISNLPLNLQLCYEELAHLGMVAHSELKLLEAWLVDVAELQLTHSRD
jgi:hypothetical protein